MTIENPFFYIILFLYVFQFILCSIRESFIDLYCIQSEFTRIQWRYSYRWMNQHYDQQNYNMSDYFKFVCVGVTRTALYVYVGRITCTYWYSCSTNNTNNITYIYVYIHRYTVSQEYTKMHTVKPVGRW